MTIPENRHNKIINAAKYFLAKKPSEVNGAEVLRLKKFCRYILGEEEKFTIDQIYVAVNEGVLPGQQSLPGTESL